MIENQTQTTVCSGLNENSVYDFIITNEGETGHTLSCEYVSSYPIVNNLVKFVVKNPNHNYLKIIVYDNFEVNTYEYDRTEMQTDEFYLPWCGHGILTIEAIRSDVVPCEHCGGNCSLQDCEEGYQCQFVGSSYQCVEKPVGCVTCQGDCLVEDCADGYSCQYTESLGYHCAEIIQPCISCGGSCYVENCSKGQACTEITSGQYSCQDYDVSLVSQWWFWLSLALGFIIIIAVTLAIVFIIRKQNSEMASVKTEIKENKVS
jgi:hypothetical protein